MSLGAGASGSEGARTVVGKLGRALTGEEAEEAERGIPLIVPVTDGPLQAIADPGTALDPDAASAPGSSPPLGALCAFFFAPDASSVLLAVGSDPLVAGSLLVPVTVPGVALLLKLLLLLAGGTGELRDLVLNNLIARCSSYIL